VNQVLDMEFQAKLKLFPYFIRQQKTKRKVSFFPFKDVTQRSNGAIRWHPLDLVSPDRNNNKVDWSQ